MVANARNARWVASGMRREFAGEHTSMDVGPVLTQAAKSSSGGRSGRSSSVYITRIIINGFRARFLWHVRLILCVDLLRTFGGFDLLLS